MGRRRKAAHVGADFADDGFRYGPANPRNGIQVLNSLCERPTGGPNFSIEGVDTLLQNIDERKQVRQNEALRIGEASRQPRSEFLLKELLLTPGRLLQGASRAESSQVRYPLG